MPVKRYDGTNWVVVAGDGASGLPGAAGIVTSATAPSDTSVLWADTTVTTNNALIPAGGTTSQVLAKSSGTDYATQWTTVSSGLTLINSTSFTASSAVNFNSVFTSTYKNYLVLACFTTSAADDIYFRYRAGGTTYSTGNYYARILNTATFTSVGAATEYVIANQATQRGGLSIDVYSPAVGSNATITSNYSGLEAGVGCKNRIVWGQLDGTYVADGFSIIPASGTITGSIEVYGYAK